MVKMAFREKIKLFPNAPGCALSQKNTKKIIPVGHFQGMVEGQAPLCRGRGLQKGIFGPKGHFFGLKGYFVMKRHFFD